MGLGIRIWAATGVAAAVIAPSAAHAACQVNTPGTMHLGAGGTYDLTLDMSAGDHCSIFFVGGTASVKFDTLSVEQAPRSGKLVKIDALSYDFAPAAGSSSDNFELKLCGTDAKGHGCNTLRYRAAVR